ncbi:MAG: VWA domain-containing protein [Planctomycetaceae bacterium]|nr:VWA domain-containing protein [Planctomycetaceae bacterium]
MAGRSQSPRGIVTLPAFAETVRVQASPRGWFSSSWLISLSLHLLIVAGLMWWIRNQPRGPVGFSDQPFVTFGVSRPGPGAGGQGAGGTNDVDTVVDENPIGGTASASLKLTLPASASLQTPQSDVETVASPVRTSFGAGVGIPLPSGGLPNARSAVEGGIIGRNGTNNAAGGKGGEGLGAEGNGGAGAPGTEFFGVKDHGSRVVFAIDCSASMTNYNAMASAKAALVAALQSLNDQQHFQIIFYNRTPQLFQPFGKSGWCAATERNKSLARQYIAQTEPDLGTDHLPAIRMALKLAPDVIYFLTDADEPQLSPQELAEIARLNQGRTRIHTIEFGKGNDLGLENFLKKLARQNDGTYRYHNVRQLALQSTP